MKTVYFVIVLSILSFNNVLGRIRNGYESELQSTKVSLQKLNLLLLEDKDMTSKQRVRIKSEIENLINYISCYELTEELIHRLRIVSPDIYIEIDSIKDRRGRPTDVYVRLIPEEKSRVKLKAAGFFEQAPFDEDANVSKYGEYSVSVDVWIADNALFLLSHELGHVKYIVPHLATYSKFYSKQYPIEEVNVTCAGHYWHDQSGKYANSFEKRFCEDKKIYLQNGGKKLDSLVSLLIRIKRNIRNLEIVHPSPAIVSNYVF